MCFDVPSEQEGSLLGSQARWPESPTYVATRVTSPTTRLPESLHERAPGLPLTVGAAGDRYEQEADRVAEQVIEGGAASRFGHSFSRIPINPLAQRACAACEQDETIRAKPAGPSLAAPSLFAGTFPPRSGGSPLPASTRAFFEPHYRQDFSSVRVHNNTAAHLFTRDLHAEAATVGRDIFFAPGRFAPETHAGRRLLAHELAHVAQQRGATGLVQRQPQTKPEADEAPPQSDVRPSELSDAELAHEINAIRRRLRAPDASSVVREQLATSLGRLGTEVLRRFPGIEKANNRGSGTGRVALNFLTAKMIQEAEAALTSGPGAEAVGGGAASAGAGATLAGVVALATVMLWSTNDTPGSQWEERENRRDAFVSQLEPEPEAKTEPMSKTPAPDQTTRENRRGNHRANIHAQGDDIPRGKEPNVPFNQPTPITKSQGAAGLERVKELCTKGQLRLRSVAFQRAGVFIRRTLHEAPPPLFWSSDRTPNAPRIDIEIIEGTAFV